jgi:hypothetical protein
VQIASLLSQIMEVILPQEVGDFESVSVGAERKEPVVEM